MIALTQAHIEDLEDLLPLFDAYRVWYRKSSNLPTARIFLKERLTNQDSIIFILRIKEIAIGFTQLYPSFSSTKMQRLWILNDLYLAEKARGYGYSKVLINAAKDYCLKTKACGILLETEVSNLIGNKLYPSTDFVLERNNFYFWTATTN